MCYCIVEAEGTVLRSEQEMMTLFIDFARNDDRIRFVTLEGSRTNKRIPADSFQDYDIAYFVTDMKLYLLYG